LDKIKKKRLVDKKKANDDDHKIQNYSLKDPKKKKTIFFILIKTANKCIYIVNLVIMVRLRLVIVIDRVGSKRDPYNMELYNTLINIKKKRIFFFFPRICLMKMFLKRNHILSCKSCISNPIGPF
jgi:hypothetical protein